MLNEVGRVGAQIRRIHRLSERVWVLEQIRRKRWKLDKTRWVKVHEVVREAIAMVKDVAAEKDVQILVAPEMEKWRSIQVDHDLFFHAALNLVHNAVKYSRGSTDVRIDGKMDYPKCQLSVGNRGVEIKEQYRNSIFKRGFRTPEAEMHIWEGSGIGLCIVKAFTDFYNGTIDYNCERIAGSYDFLTVFRLTITGAIL